MIELHLIGYTSDLRYLVLDVDEDGGRARYRVPVDADLLATLDEMRDRRREAGFGDPPPSGSEPAPTDVEPADPRPLFGERPTAPEAPAHRDPEPEDLEDPEPEDPEDPADIEEVDEVPDEPEAAEPEVDEPDDADDPQDGATEQDDQGGDEAGGDPDADGRVDSLLSPAEIQTLLRRGISPRTVADRAGTEVTWIERWLPPILAERRQVLQEARGMCLERARLGVSRQPLGEAVTSNLRAKRVDLDDVEWTTKRRADGSWTVSVRYRSKGRRRTASWRLDREQGRLSPSSDLARELGFARSRRRRR